MNREVHVRFWEGLAVKFRWATQLSHSRGTRKGDDNETVQRPSYLWNSSSRT